MQNPWCTPRRARDDRGLSSSKVSSRQGPPLPEPSRAEGHAVQLLAMEIDYGPFERQMTLPAEVEIDKAHAEQRNGLLWISLPLKQS